MVDALITFCALAVMVGFTTLIVVMLAASIYGIIKVTRALF